MTANENKVKKLNCSVLYVEDDDFVRNALGRTIALLVENVYMASDGAKGLAMFKSLKPDIVISDISMPLMDGVEMCMQIRELDKKVPIIITTAHSDTEYFVGAIEAQVTHFMLKPVDIKLLGEILNDSYRHINMAKEFDKQKKLLDEYKKAVDVSNIVSKADKNGVITYINDEFCRISGYTKEELIGQNHNIVRHPNVPKDVFRELWSTILSKKPWSGIVENRAKDGSSYWVDATIIPILDENDEVVEFIGVRKDITKMIQQEKEIEKLHSNQLKHSVDMASKINAKACIKTLPYPAMIVDRDAKIIEVNETTISLFDPVESGNKLQMLRSGGCSVSDIFELFERSQGGESENEVGWVDLMTWYGLSEDAFFIRIKGGDKKDEFKLVVQVVECDDNDKEFVLFFK